MAESKYGFWESYEGLTVHQRHPNLSERALQELLRQRYVLAENQTLGLFKNHVLRASVFPDKASPDAEKSLTRSPPNDRQQRHTRLRYKGIVLQSGMRRGQRSPPVVIPIIKDGHEIGMELVMDKHLFSQLAFYVLSGATLMEAFYMAWEENPNSKHVKDSSSQ